MAKETWDWKSNPEQPKGKKLITIDGIRKTFSKVTEWILTNFELVAVTLIVLMVIFWSVIEYEHVAAMFDVWSVYQLRDK